MINTLAVVGATGAVGKIILEQIASRKFPAKNIKEIKTIESTLNNLFI